MTAESHPSTCLLITVRHFDKRTPNCSHHCRITPQPAYFPMRHTEKKKKKKGKKKKKKKKKNVHRIAGMTAGAHPSTYLIPYDTS